MIDIGGPTMVRASAKNHRHVYVVTNPARYDWVISVLEPGTAAVPDVHFFRQTLALEAFEHTAAYDVAIAQELHRRVIGDPADGTTMEEQRERLPHSVLKRAIAWIPCDTVRTAIRRPLSTWLTTLLKATPPS